MYKRILIGGSAGSFEQVSQLLSAESLYHCPPIIFIMHLSENYDAKNLCNAFQSLVHIKCKLVQNHDWIESDTLYIADGRYHVLLDNDGQRFRLYDDEPFHYAKPSIDLLFESCCGSEAKSTLAIVLSGANSDGSTGLKKLFDAGAHCCIASPNNTPHSAMPTSALHTVPNAEVLPDEVDSQWLVKLLACDKRSTEHLHHTSKSKLSNSVHASASDIKPSNTLVGGHQ
ncbi:hypothetical protein OE749_09930 [Aestuariibacter sp. AA17]|uniref:protein-glutamate methylesterase n=1 Tax=Fluctibacter corallii TaxID=2984329 RepID=A0ABT3A8J9_9ALTE|nr:chemotaxis protein CheB [Aestuariibacter sp. AA17]MCV2885015.1 hypothetical protein [Aestuariibacter sp. AA17]